MLIRRIVLAMGVVIALVGASQLIWTSWWLGVTQSVMEMPGLRAVGVLVIAVGILLVYAGLRRIVGLPVFVIIVGVWSALAGALLLFNPPLVKDLVNAFVLYRSAGFQAFAVRAAGVVRVAIGLALVYAAARPNAKALPQRSELPFE